MGQITSPYEQQKPVKDLNKYATLMAVGELFSRTDEEAIAIHHLMWLGCSLHPP